MKFDITNMQNKLNPMENGELSTHQLLQAQAHVWNHNFSFIKSLALKCAVELRIPDIIHNHGRPIPLSLLVNSITTTTTTHKTKSQCLSRLMRLLVHSNFFIQHNSDDDQDPRYSLAPSSRLLLTGAPLSLAPYVLFSLDPLCTKPLQHMGEWLATDGHSTPFEVAYGSMFWEMAAKNPGWSRLFDEAMSSDSSLVGHVFVKEYKHVLEGIGTVVDVGGGRGQMAKAIVDAVPGVKCIVLDLPRVLDGLESSDRLSFVGGDIFESIPPAHAVLLKNVLHDWDDEACVKILKRCREAIVASNCSGGKVIIIDIVVDVNKEDNEIVENQLCFDIAMMSCVNAKERSEKEWAKLFSNAGFITYKITPAFGVKSLIELYP